MFKFKLNRAALNELIDDLEGKMKAAGALAASQVYQRGLQLARQSFGSSGFKRWSEGYNFSKVDDGLYIISLEGKLATMMEDGFGPGEISQMILQGNRAKFNQKTGKKYVDVPFGKEVDKKGQVSIQGQKFQVQGFKNSAELGAAFGKPQNVQATFSRPPGVKVEERIVQRAKKVNDLIKSVDKSGKTAYLTIRRLGENSTWPQRPYTGPKIFETLESEIEDIFSKALQQFME